MSTTTPTDCKNVSHHYYITYSYSGRKAPPTSGAALGDRWAGRGRTGWRTARMDADLLVAAVVVSE